MDSWTLQGDSYSFLRSAPRTFSLCHRDGTPNHVEIFDIINVPSQRSAISETTCLCDIFGDDCESPSLSSSPAAGAFVPPQRELDETAAASPLADDLNDSSGSYHTAPGSSEGEEGFEDSRERITSPLLQTEPSERTLSKGQGTSSGLPEASEGSSPNLEPKGESPVTHFFSASPTTQVITTGKRTPSPGHISPYTPSPEGRLSSLSSSSLHNRHSPLSPDPKQAPSEAEQSPSFKDRPNSPSHQSVSPSTEPRHCVISSSSESVSPEYRVTRDSPESKTRHVNQIISPSPELTLEDVSQDFTESESATVISSPGPSPCSAELLSQSRETLVSPEPSSSSRNTHTSSPFTEPRGRVSLPDLFSRDSTPELKDYTHTPELVSDPSPGERDTTTTPETQGTRLEAGLDSTVSSPVPRYTPPSPVSSIARSPEPVEPELKSTPPSPGLLSAASSAKSETRTPSPDQSSEVKHNSTFCQIRTQVSSPVVSYSLSPSPGVRDICSPTEHRHTTPSPEIRITRSSPEVRSNEQSSNLETPSASPLLEPPSALSRSPTSSPHITGISYSVVQPEDRDSPPFPELAHLSTLEPDGTHMSSEPRSLTASRNSTESRGTPKDSPHTLGFSSSVQQSEIYQHRYQTPSPQPNPHTPSPKPRYQTPSPDRHQSPSSHYSSRDPSPAALFPGQRYQRSPASVSPEYIPQNPQPASPVRKTPEVERNSSSLDITETQLPTVLGNDSVSPSFQLDRTDRSAEIKSCSPVEIVCSSVSTSPAFTKEDSLPKQSTEKERPPSKQETFQDRSSVASSSEERQEVCPLFFQKEDTEIKSPSPNLIVSKDKSPNISPVHRAISNSPVQRLENHQSEFTNYSLTSENSNLLKSTFTPASLRKQLTPKVRRENRERSTEDMSRHVSRRRTPSPPLTRFTPVHIIAPEKPYRQWQNRSRSPSQVVTSPPSGNLQKAVANRESPYAADSNSQAHWVRQGRQLEIESEMLLEQQREVDRERQRDREIGRGRKREERVSEKGEGWQGDASYRGEQVELSFSARNRKGPVSRSAAPTSRETRQGLPTVHSYSESLLAPRQLQQQPRLASQQDTRGVSASRRLQHRASQNKITAPGCVVVNRPCQSSSSSMGSELDEADNEVKWFTDLAFRSLSSPEVDYLDMYNSSHRSSTNISQPSTQDSPAGVNAAWPAYADFRGSAPKLDHDELSFQQPPACYPDGLDTARCYELGSFECVDVAVEKEECRRVRRGVPKRQIQLKRKNNTEGKQDESSENSSPGLPVMVESPSQETHTRATLMRQHSTPAAIQECYPTECSPEPNQQNERKSKLQKSASMDETCTKTKMATCLIKSVLSKKMQSVDKQPDGEDLSPTFVENSPPTESEKHDAHNLSSSLQSDHSLSSEGLPVRGEPCTKEESKPPKSFGVRSTNRPSSSSSSRSVNFSQTDSEEADSQSRNATPLRSEMRSELKVPFDSKQQRTEQADDSKKYEREEGDSANATAKNPVAPSATGSSSMQTGMTNRDQECENTEDHKQLQQGDKGPSMSTTQDATMKAVEKKKASLNVCLTPEAENKPASSPDVTDREREERMEISAETKKEAEESENNKVKGPIHKVRDVRRLVKNTYNLSFKAATAVNMNEDRGTEEIIAGEEIDVQQEIKREEREEEFWKEEQTEEVKDSKMLTPPLPNKGKCPTALQPMQIEYKAVCWKEDKNKITCVKKESEYPGDKPQASSKPLTEINEESHALKVHHMTGDAAKCEHETTEIQEREMHKVPDNEKPVVVRTDRKPPVLGSLPKMPSKEREVSTAVVLIREAPSKTKTCAASPAREEIPSPIQVPATSPSPGPLAQGSAPGGHSVSMILKEKGYQADIGAVVGDPNAAGSKGAPRKHVNSLEIPLQTIPHSEGGWTESQRERTFSSSSSTCGTSPATEALMKTREDEGVSITGKDTEKQKGFSVLRNTQEQTPLPAKQKDLGDFEAVKRLDPTFPPRSPAIRRFKPQPIEVKSLSKEPPKQEMPTNSAGSNRPQTIEVKSIAKNCQKPAVPPKPSCKFKPSDLGTNEAQRPSTMSTMKAQGEERSQTIVVSSPTIYRKISSDSTSTSNYSRKLAVSAVSSLKPPANKTTATAISALSKESTAPADTETANDRGQQQQQPPTASPQSSRYTQKPITLATVPTSSTASCVTSASGPGLGPVPNQIPGTAPAGASQPGRQAVVDPNSQLPCPSAAYPHEQAMQTASNNTKQPAAVSTTQVPRYTQQPCRRSLSSERSRRAEDLRFYASDDPPSYDERESFSPLALPDLRSNRYQPSSRPPPCSCTAGCPSHPGLTPPHHHRSPHNLTPPAPSHSPGQALPYPVTQPPLRPHQCRPDPQPMSYLPSSPKSSPHGPNQPPTMYQSLHQPAPCPPHHSLMQGCPADRPLPPTQHIDSRRPPIHRSPHQQAPGMAPAPYSDPGHSHSPGLPPMDPQYLCGPQSMGPSYGSEYGGDSSSLYSESSYGQTPRRVLLDPETGKYFYIEVPVQPLRKMLFDPETGQYVEVLIPQQAMSHSGLYPPSAAPYPPLHNPNMYAPAPQYMPYGAPPPPPHQAHPQAQPQPPRYPETSAAAAMHPSGPVVSYRNPSGQGSKPEPQNHPPLDHSYLESMYYVPTGMNASPNTTPPDYYHKHPPNLPPTGGKRS